MAHHELREGPIERAHDQVRRQEGKTDLERAVVEHGFSRGDEGRTRRTSHPPRGRRRRSQATRAAATGARHQRRRDRASITRNARWRDTDAARALSSARMSRLVALTTVHGQHQGGGDGDRPATSRRPRGGRHAIGGQQPQRQEDDEDPDREVDEEDPVPVEHVGQDASEQHADAAAPGGDEPEDAHRLGPLARLREEGHHQRERNRGGDCSAQALDGTRADEHALRGRQTADERGQREQRDASEEQPTVTEEVAEAPAATGSRR